MLIERFDERGEVSIVMSVGEALALRRWLRVHEGYLGLMVGSGRARELLQGLESVVPGELAAVSGARP
jgi:hypothetical protein